MKRLLLAVVLFLGCAFSVQADDAKPIHVLIITGDHVAHDWKATTLFLNGLLTRAGMDVDVTPTPARDLTADHLARYDVFLLNYRDSKNGRPETRWSEKNFKALAHAVAEGKGLVVYHYASSAFTGGGPFDKEFEQLIAGGWRKQGFHGKRHVFPVTMSNPDHPITRGMPAKFTHSNDELYQNSLVPEGSEVLATAYSDKSKDPKNTGKEEPVVWVTQHGKGRVCENALGHDVAAMQDPGFQTLLVRCVEWAATGQVRHPVPEQLKSGEK
jgi:type 1 glutamine amidotransferase